MLEPKASRFFQATLQSGLVDAQAMQACWDAISEEKRTAEHIDRRLARQAVQTNILTLWQAQQLLAGRSSGFKIDRYTLLELIGQGGMGRVYLARDTRLNRRVALKILSPERVNNPRAIARFHREALVGAQLQHENLVRIYDEGEANGKCYLVMEYIEGKNIGQMIGENGPIPFSVAARLARQVALGLEHAQRKGLIHRDVNPYNILVTRDGTAKLTDLGLAIDLAEQDRVTRDGATVGTFDYVSPEQARHSHSVDTRSDIYSLGCSLYHMLTGHVPFPCVSLPEKLFGHQVTIPPSVLELAPNVPEALAAVVARTLQKAPDQRYATPLELAQALEAFADETAGFEGEIAPGSRSGSRIESIRTQQITTPRPGDGTTTPISLAQPAPGAPASPISPILEIEPDAAQAPLLVREAPDDGGFSMLGLDLGKQAPLARSRALTKPKSKIIEKGAVKEPSPAQPVFFQEPNASQSSHDDGGIGGLGLDFGPEAPLSGRNRPATPKPTPHEPAKPPAPELISIEAVPAYAPELERNHDEGGTGFLGVNLSEGSARPKVVKREKEPLGVEARAEPLNDADAVGGRWIVPGALAAGVLLVSLASGFAYRQFSGKRASGEVKAVAPEEKGDRGKAGVKSKSAGAEAAVVARRPVGKEVEVMSPGDDVPTIHPDLKSAMRAAIGSRGDVLLRDTTPMTVTAAEAATMAGGLLSIKAIEGTQPVLRVEIKGDKPFLSTRSNCVLRIEGVTFLVKYNEPGQTPAPLISAGGNVTLDRCAFRMEGSIPGSRAVALEGGGLTATGCWFENFERALDVACFGGSVTKLQHCMFVSTRADDSPSPALAAPWALRFRSMPGGFVKSGRRLLLDHCTTRGRGFLEFAGFSAEAPISVDLSSCVVSTESLISWEPGATADPKSKDATAFNRKALTWTGHDNLYEVQGKAWVRIVAHKGAPSEPMPDGPTDLAAWSRQIAEERDPLSTPLKFANEAATLSEHPVPPDFAVLDQGAKPVGANPELVGPGAKPVAGSTRKR